MSETARPGSTDKLPPERDGTRPEKTLVHYEAQGGLAVLTLDDPPVNGYTYPMMRQLDEAILQARFDDQVHVRALDRRVTHAKIVASQHDAHRVPHRAPARAPPETQPSDDADDHVQRMPRLHARADLMALARARPFRWTPRALASRPSPRPPPGPAAEVHLDLRAHSYFAVIYRLMASASETCRLS